MQHAVLLRGINLGSHNRIPMTGLREALASRGFHQARSYLQSGNLVVESDLAGRDVEQAVGALISEEFGLDIAVMALSAPQLAAIVSDNPFRAQADADPTRVHAMFVSPMPPRPVLAEVDAPRFLPEEFLPGPGVIYLHLPNGIGRAKLPDALTRAVEDSIVTVRNWRTVTAVAGMVEG